MRLVGLVLLVPGCCGAIPATPLVHVSDQRTNPRPLEAFHTPDYSRLEPVQVATYRALHEEVDKLVHTSEFAAALRDVDTLAPTPGGVRISGARFAAMYLHGDADVESLPVCYRFKSGGRSETASTGTYASRHGCADGKAAAADITLRSVTFERANSEKLEEHACAVNSLAHEWAHALTVTEHRTLVDVHVPAPRLEVGKAALAMTRSGDSWCVPATRGEVLALRDGKDVRRIAVRVLLPLEKLYPLEALGRFTYLGDLRADARKLDVFDRLKLRQLLAQRPSPFPSPTTGGSNCHHFPTIAPISTWSPLATTAGCTAPVSH